MPIGTVIVQPNRQKKGFESHSSISLTQIGQ